MEARHIERIAKALADPTRFRILKAIAATDEINCGDLARRFPIAQATVSHHLKILEEAGLVHVRAAGQHHFFRADHVALDDYRRALGAAFAPRARTRATKRRSS
jgi:ArsR family transcriptional regulator